MNDEEYRVVTDAIEQAGREGGKLIINERLYQIVLYKKKQYTYFFI